MASLRSLRVARAGILTRMGEGLRFKVLSVLAILVVATGVVVACGGDDGSSPADCTGTGCDGGTLSDATTGSDTSSGEDGNAPPTDGGSDADSDSSVVINCGDGGAPGTLDESFGDGGIVWLKYTGSSAYAVAVQPDGKLIIGGNTGTGNGGSFALVRLLADGRPDSTFGSAGLVEKRVGNAANSVMSVAIQPDGRILATGWCRSTGQDFDFALLRLLADGGADPSFGDAGAVLTDFAGRGDYAKTVLVLPDGRIVVAGASDSNGVGSSSEFAVARYASDGTLDPTFGNGGKVLVDMRGTVDSPGAAALVASGKIAIAGASGDTASISTPTDMSAVVLLGDGGLETAFAEAGRFIESRQTSAFAVAADSSGRLLLAGSVGSDFALLRLTNAGAPDATFGSGGLVTTDLGAADSAAAVLVQEDGKIVVAGESSQGGVRSIAMARYLVTGALDPSFGSGGKAVTLPGSDAYYGISGAALTGCGIITAGPWAYGPSGFMQNAMGVAKYHR